MPVLNTADAVYLGSMKAAAVYLGSDKVWQTTEVPPPEPNVAINGTWEPVTVPANSHMVVSVAGGPGNPGDWVELVLASDPPTTPNVIDWCYLSGTGSYPPSGLTDATVHLRALVPAGTQMVVFWLANDLFDVIAQSAIITSDGGGGGGTITPPAQAVSAGFDTLIFADEFDVMPDIDVNGQSGHKWNSGMWWQGIFPATAYSQSDSVLTITALDDSSHYYLTTQAYHFMSGIYFLGGYFEARMQCTDWSSFWLYKADQPCSAGVNPADPMS